MSRNPRHNGPLVTVLLSTYNRRRYLPEAIASVLNQTYRNFELFVIRDGGEEAADIVQSFSDPRIRFIDRGENRGKAASLNQALAYAKGRYTCYIDDDDVFFPNHIETLVKAIEQEPGRYGAVYSDLYKAHCKVEPDGSRTILARNVEVCRDYDPLVLLFYNLALHVSVLHRTDLFEQCGLYNEQLPILIDWDLTRKLCFYTDFKHVREVTGQFYAPVTDCDRISVQKRKNRNEYIYNLLTIRSTRPPKPWPKLHDLSVFLIWPGVSAGGADLQAISRTLTDIWSHGFYPHEIYVPLPADQLAGLRTVVPNVIGVDVPAGAGEGEKVDACLEVCRGDYAAVVPCGFVIDMDECMWVERALHPLIRCRDSMVGYHIPVKDPAQWAGVFRTRELKEIRRRCPSPSILTTVERSGIVMYSPTIHDYPFQLDHVLKAAEELEKNGEWLRAAKFFSYMHEHFDNEIWLKARLANALCRGQRYDAAIEICDELNTKRPTPSTWLIEARAYKGKENWQQAIESYKKAESLLDGREWTCTTT